MSLPQGATQGRRVGVYGQGAFFGQPAASALLATHLRDTASAGSLSCIIWFWWKILRAGGTGSKMADMAKYLISFPSAAMVVPNDELEAVGRDARAVVEEAKAAGVYVFAGGVDETVPPTLVSADGTFVDGGYPWSRPLTGGFTVLEVPSREEATRWAARLASACRCAQELRVFGEDPAL